MSDDTYERGMRVRREVLGDEHVDRAIEGTTEHTAAFQEFITRYAWGEIWSRPGLDRKTRSAVTLTALTALGRFDELATMSAEGYAACCEAVGAFDFRRELHRIGTPTLVIFGAEDPVTPPDVRETLAGGIPDVRVVEIANAAHLANVEQPQAFTDHLRSAA